MEVFFAHEDDCTRDEIFLRDEEVKHLTRVLRKGVGDRIAITNGKGVLWEAEIRRMDKTVVQCSILETHYNVREMACDITLAISLLKNPGRFDFCIEKATEIGVKRIVPFQSHRTIAQGDHRKRWEDVARAAMKQCGRSMLPTISPVQPFAAVVGESSRYAVALCPHEKAPGLFTISSLFHSLPKPASIILCIGPEGGFTEKEVATAEAYGWKLVSLGSQRLRSETAAIVAVSQLVAFLE